MLARNCVKLDGGVSKPCNDLSNLNRFEVRGLQCTVFWSCHIDDGEGNDILRTRSLFQSSSDPCRRCLVHTRRFFLFFRDNKVILSGLLLLSPSCDLRSIEFSLDVLCFRSCGHACYSPFNSLIHLPFFVKNNPYRLKFFFNCHSLNIRDTIQRETPKRAVVSGKWCRYLLHRRSRSKWLIMTMSSEAESSYTAILRHSTSLSNWFTFKTSCLSFFSHPVYIAYQFMIVTSTLLC